MVTFIYRLGDRNLLLKFFLYGDNDLDLIILLGDLDRVLLIGDHDLGLNLPGDLDFLLLDDSLSLDRDLGFEVLV